MSEKSEEFFRKIIDFLPSTDAAYRESISTYGEVLETIIIEDIFSRDYKTAKRRK